MMSEQTAYVLGTDDVEVARLDAQASSIAGATEALLRAAGIGGAMRVLDLGTGLGHVAFMVAGLARSRAARCSASTRRSGCSRSPSSGARPQAPRTCRIPAGRTRGRSARASRSTPSSRACCCSTCPTAEEVVRHQLEALRPGGTMVVVEFDIGALRAEPQVPLVDAARDWMEAAFRAAGADPRIGARAGQLLRRAGFADVTTFGIQAYFAPDRPDRAAAVRGRRALAGTADRGAGHRGRSGTGTRDAAGADSGAGRRPRRGDPAARRRRRMGHPAARRLRRRDAELPGKDHAMSDNAETAILARGCLQRPASSLERWRHPTPARPLGRTRR